MAAHSCSTGQNFLRCQCLSCTTHLHSDTRALTQTSVENVVLQLGGKRPQTFQLQDSHYDRYWLAVSLYVMGSQLPGFQEHVTSGCFIFRTIFYRKTIFSKPQKNKLLTQAFQACWTSQGMSVNTPGFFNNVRACPEMTTLSLIRLEIIQSLLRIWISIKGTVHPKIKKNTYFSSYL